MDRFCSYTKTLSVFHMNLIWDLNHWQSNSWFFMDLGVTICMFLWNDHDLLIIICWNKVWIQWKIKAHLWAACFICIKNLKFDNFLNSHSCASRRIHRGSHRWISRQCSMWTWPWIFDSWSWYRLQNLRLKGSLRCHWLLLLYSNGCRLP